MASRFDRFAAKFPKLAEAASTPWELVSAMRLMEKSAATKTSSEPTIEPAKTIRATGAPPAITPGVQPAIAASDAPHSPFTISEKKPPMQTKPISLADRVKAIQMSDTTGKMTYEKAFGLALKKTNVTNNDPQPEIRVNMSDPGSDAATRPTAITDKMRAEYDAVKGVLRDADVRQARETAVERTKQTIPARTDYYSAALKLVANSPQMSKATADKICREAQAQDEAAAQAQTTAMLNPPIRKYNETLIRG